MNRRDILKKSIVGLGMLGSSGAALANVCRLTAAQPEGPFYPENDQFDKDNDLTTVAGRNGVALGEVVILKGRVLDDLCHPVEGAMVEIWQAAASGKYNHSRDPNPAKLDPNFQYWGQAITNADGEYSFKTIKPGAYPAGGSWVRPPHIHLKVHLRGYEELTTQVYFAEEKVLNQKDRLLQSLSAEDQKNLIVEFKKSSHAPRTGVCDFSIKSFT